jgi:hypothetical protein
MADLTTLLNKFLQNLYAGVLDLGGSSTVTIGSGTSVTSVAVGSGTTTALVGGTLFTSTTAAATTGTAEETLMSYTMPANTLAVNGRGVRITAWGSTAANVNVSIDLDDAPIGTPHARDLLLVRVGARRRTGAAEARVAVPEGLSAPGRARAHVHGNEKKESRGAVP